MNSLNVLFEYFENNFKENSKLSDYVNLINQYNGNDWQKYVNISNNSYNKILINRNSKLEMFIICWDKNIQSGIHDHPTNGCILKVLKGKLIEQSYCKNENKIKFVKEIHCCTNDVSYQEGSNGLHNIINEDSISVSLHIYSPPNYKINFL